MSRFTELTALLARKRLSPTRTKISKVHTGYVNINIQSNVDGYMKYLLEITKNGKINQATAVVLARIGKDLAVKYTRRMQGTGALSKSFYVVKEKESSGETVFALGSDSSYAAVWTHPGDDPGFQGLGNFNRIGIWMNGKRFVDPSRYSKGRGKKKKKSHLGKSPSQESIRKSVQFLISRSIREARNNHPSGKSRLRKISTGGNRTYDYPMLVMRDMIPAMERVKILLDEVLSGD